MPAARSSAIICALTGFAVLALTGCASPGPPRAPSLQLPAPVSDLSATRTGNDVELRFTLPQRTTDKLPLRSATLRVNLCRALAASVCTPLATRAFSAFVSPDTASLHDLLTGALASGAPQLLTYRIEVLNDRSRSAGFSDAAYAAAGAAPPPVEAFRAEGSRLGIVLRWKPAESGSGSSSTSSKDPEEVVLRREDLAPTQAARQAPKAATADTHPHHAAAAPPKATTLKNEGDDANVVWLATTTAHEPFASELVASELEPASPGRAQAAPTTVILDATALPNEPYRYTAERRRSVQLGGRTLELRSEPSAPVSIVLRDTYPPPTPTDLTAAIFTVPASEGIASKPSVDLIWQPVDEPRLAGYNVYRQAIDASGAAAGKSVRLNDKPVALPAFHDAELPTASARLRYSVTAVDLSGNESGAATATVENAGP